MSDQPKDAFASAIMLVLLDIPDFWEDEKYTSDGTMDTGHERQLRDASLMAQGIAWGLRDRGYGAQAVPRTTTHDFEAHAEHQERVRRGDFGGLGDD